MRDAPLAEYGVNGLIEVFRHASVDPFSIVAAGFDGGINEIHAFGAIDMIGEGDSRLLAEEVRGDCFGEITVNIGDCFNEAFWMRHGDT